ncbi:MAG: acyl-[acyl-carrier-protein] thioesterase [Candidatus Heimdallarchaeaceae archaeon]
MYEITFVPKINEIDLNEKVKFSALIDYLQHAAYMHAHRLGVGHHQIFHRGLTWLLLRYAVEVIRYPTLEEEIKVVTWVAESQSPKFTIRDFEIYDEKNNIICKVTTSWLLYNYRKRQIVNFVDFWCNYDAKEKRALDYDFPKLRLPKKPSIDKKIKVRLHDLDINQHVNHRMYIEWIIEGMPQKVSKKHVLEKLEISFKEQSFYEDELLVETETEKIQNTGQIKAIHQITKGKKKSLVSKAVTYWRMNEEKTSNVK